MPQENNGRFWGNALLGACLAVFASVFASAYLAAALGDTYNVRCAVYAACLVWVIAGAVTIFTKTWKNETQSFSLRFVLIWFFSVWLWPLLVAAGLLKKR